MGMNIFRAIWLGDCWGPAETRSGPGSSMEATVTLRRELPRIVEELGITSVVDLGCGEAVWTPEFPGYLGIDIVPEVIERARANHPGWGFTVADVTEHVPSADLILCRDVLMHLPLVKGLTVLRLIREWGAPYFAATTFRGGENHDVAAGNFYYIDMTAEPFSLGEPEYLIADDWRYPSKALGIWKL